MEAARSSSALLMVGYNRRFAPHARRAQAFFAGHLNPLSISYRVNAGRIPLSHWLQDPAQGGRRIIGEVCHFIDFMHFMTGALTTRVYAEAIQARNSEVPDEDSVFITVRLSDGSNGSIAYLSEGDKALPKERVEIFGGGKSFVLDDFRTATLYRYGREEVMKLRAQDKGQREEVRTLCALVREGGTAPISLDDLATSTRATFRILESLRTGMPVAV
jgi:predicted dehydrogenase